MIRCLKKKKPYRISMSKLGYCEFEIYTDGSSLGNPGKGGWASVIIKNDKSENAKTAKTVKELAGYAPDTTNNKMEMLSVIKALEDIGHLNDCVITVYSDSAYVVTGVTNWLPGWIHRDWVTSTGDAVKNKDLWEEFQKHCAFYGSKLKFEKVKAHSGKIENERCDYIAKSVAGDQKVNINIAKDWMNFDNYQRELKEGKLGISKTTKSGTKRKKAMCYVSLVDGDIYVDTEWSECQKRMKGHKGCLFKKAANECERDTIQAEFIGRLSEENLL
jgi:ribonuclease HI